MYSKISRPISKTAKQKKSSSQRQKDKSFFKIIFILYIFSSAFTATMKICDAFDMSTKWMRIGLNGALNQFNPPYNYFNNSKTRFN